MKSMPKVITLCGSTRFKKEYEEANERLTLEGCSIFSVGLYGHADDKFETAITPDVKEMLDELHFRKIDLSDEIFVINPGGYIGTSTRNEIMYAISTRKKVRFLEPLSDTQFLNMSEIALESYKYQLTDWIEEEMRERIHSREELEVIPEEE